MTDIITLKLQSLETAPIEDLLDAAGSSLGDLITLADMILDTVGLDVDGAALAGAVMVQANDIKRAIYAIRDEIERRQEKDEKRWSFMEQLLLAETPEGKAAMKEEALRKLPHVFEALFTKIRAGEIGGAA